MSAKEDDLNSDSNDTKYLNTKMKVFDKTKYLNKSIKQIELQFYLVW